MRYRISSASTAGGTALVEVDPDKERYEYARDQRINFGIILAECRYRRRYGWGLILLILWWIAPDRFFRMQKPLIVSAGIFWGMLGIFIVQSFWDDYYRYFYPTWMHGWGIILFGPAIGVVLAILFYWIARRFRSHPIQAFLILVGIEALLEHLMGIYSFKIMDTPMFRGVSLFSILAFSIPEYIFYWCLIILAAFLVQQGYARIMGIPGIKPV
jgi:hypothetical protein